MSSWRNLGFWGKVWAFACLALMVLTASESGGSWMGGGSSGRKRVFSPGFIVLCAFVAMVELILLNHFYDARPR